MKLAALIVLIAIALLVAFVSARTPSRTPTTGRRYGPAREILRRISAQSIRQRRQVKKNQPSSEYGSGVYFVPGMGLQYQIRPYSDAEVLPRRPVYRRNSKKLTFPRRPRDETSSEYGGVYFVPGMGLQYQIRY